VNDEEPSKKVKHEDTNFFYLLALPGPIEDNDDMWLINGGTFRDMIGDCVNISSMREKRISHRVELGDNNSYAIKGIWKVSIELESCNNVHLSNFLYVPSLKKNLVSISCLEDKGDKITFVDGKVLVWPNGSSINDEIFIGISDGRL